MTILIAWEFNTIVKLFTIAFGMTTAVIAISTFRMSIKEKRAARHWQQAHAARELVKEMHTNAYASAATAMLDWFCIDQPDNYDPKKMVEIEFDEVKKVLPRLREKGLSDKEQYILMCFDWYFYFIDRIEQHIIDGLISYDNVKYIFYPYYRKIKEDETLFDQFAEERNYILAPQFWHRYENDKAFDRGLMFKNPRVISPDEALLRN